MPSALLCILVSSAHVRICTSVTCFCFPFSLNTLGIFIYCPYYLLTDAQIPVYFYFWGSDGYILGVDRKTEIVLLVKSVI